MMQAVILKCRPGAQFHLGKIALDENSSLDATTNLIHSDTLFSALINIAAKVYPEYIDKFIEAFEQQKIQVSSCFYCLERKGKFIYLLPKPLSYNISDEKKGEGENKDYKALKKVAFISQKVWEMGLPYEKWETDCVTLQKKFVVHKTELTALGISEEMGEKIKIYNASNPLPKVFVHKKNKEDSLYYQTNVQIADNTFLIDDLKVHFYCLLDTEGLEADMLRKIKTLFFLLADEGIGGERSVGCGSLEGIDFQEFNLNVGGESSEQYCTLSLGRPINEDEFSQFNYYKMVTRGGRRLGKNEKTVASVNKLKRVKMITEGALLSKKVAGSIIDIAPSGTKNPHKRNGMVFSLPIHENLAR